MADKVTPTRGKRPESKDPTKREPIADANKQAPRDQDPTAQENLQQRPPFTPGS